MTDLAPIRTDYGAEDRRWLRDIHGLTDTIGGTLDGSLFDPAAFPDGVVPSGTALAAVTAAGPNQRLLGPYTPGATNGLQTAKGLSLDSHKVSAGRRTSIAVFDHGAVLRNFLPNLPTAAGKLDAAGETALPRIRFTNG